MRASAYVVIIAVIAAGLTALLAKMWLNNHSAPPPVQTAQTIAVMVLARNVAAGSPLQNDDLRYDNWPASLAAPRLITRQSVEDGRAAFVGQIARRALSEGEPFTTEATARREDAGLMAAMLTPGMRAISIAITNPTAVSGFITPGDHVDVLMAADLAHVIDGERPPPTARLARYSAETILTNVRVLAIDQQFSRNQDGGGIQGKTATLEVSPKQAETLTVAGLLGSMQLVLHGKDDAKPQAANFSGDAEISMALRSLLANRPARAGGGGSGPVVEVNRAGAISMEGFSK